MSNDTSPLIPISPPVDITLTEGQKDVIVTIRIVMSFFSLFGSLAVLALMIRYKKYFGPHRLICILALCNLGEAISNLLSFGTFNHESQRSALCYFQGITMQFFQVSAFVWTAIIAINLWLVVVYRRLDVDSFQSRYHFIAWSLISIFTIAPNFTTAYGLANAWCWINKAAQWGNVWRFTTFFVPFYCSWLIIFVCYVWIWRVITSSFENTRPDEKENTMKQISRLRAYPIVFVILYIPATINRIYNWASNDDIFILFILQAITAPSVGFVNSIIYGFDIEIRNRIANSCIRRGWCSYCLGDVELPENLSRPTNGQNQGGTAQSAFGISDIDAIELSSFGNETNGAKDNYSRFKRDGRNVGLDEDEDIIDDSAVLDERGSIKRTSGSPSGMSSRSESPFTALSSAKTTEKPKNPANNGGRRVGASQHLLPGESNPDEEDTVEIDF